MKTIIEELNDEGINLQETILNLEHQGYKDYLNAWIMLIFGIAMWKRKNEIIIELLKKENLI